MMNTVDDNQQHETVPVFDENDANPGARRIEQSNEKDDDSRSRHDEASTTSAEIDHMSIPSVDTGTSPSTTQHAVLPPGHDEESISIARKENKAVHRWRIVVIVCLVLCTLGVAAAVYYFVDKGERQEFYTQFEFDSFKTLDALGNHLDMKMGAIDAFVVPLVSYAKIFDKEWPLVTIPDHAVRASKIRSLSNAISIEQYQIVKQENRTDWEQYAITRDGWVQEAIQVQSTDQTYQGEIPTIDEIETKISTIHFNGQPAPFNRSLYAPSWQTYPIVPGIIPYNTDALSHARLGAAVSSAIEGRKVVISEVLNLLDSSNDSTIIDPVNAINNWAAKHVSNDIDHTEPLVRFLYPVLENASTSVSPQTRSLSEVVAVIATSFYWSSFLKEILPAGEMGLVVVFENACNQSFTYQIDGPDATFLGVGDLHDRRYSEDRDMVYSSSLNDLSAFNAGGQRYYSGLPLSASFCPYRVSTYPSKTMESQSRTAGPIIYMVIAILIFIFTSLVFLLYDKLVAIRQRKVMKTAMRSTAIVSSLFPSNVRDRLYRHSSTGRDDDSGMFQSSSFQPTKLRLKSFLNDGTWSGESSSASDAKSGTMANKPIADLFTDCTVSFADIANFTAWSSVREPGQVFTLLETVYGAFDRIALRRGVFKVETIGDCYVAVTGLPEPREDHAVAMAKFAKDCRDKFEDLCFKLEEQLGPETGDLKLRFGLHSGPVTAGVLRGQKSRFQLFGDTVNTAARMESTGLPSQIQASQSTADLLVEFDKSHWIRAREELIEAKGKGLLQTYWVEPKSSRSSSILLDQSKLSGISQSIDEKTKRLIKWNVDVLSRHLKKIVASRKNQIMLQPETALWALPRSVMVIEEVKEVIELPEFDGTGEGNEEREANVLLDPVVRNQLHDFVTAIACMYHYNPFHNFAHAGHVSMSVAKLLNRIVAPDQVYDSENTDTKIWASALHDHTYGITSDPLTQFACIFSALIHDVDHPGVPNAQLVKEDTDLARLYQGKSVAEQNSVNLAWELLQQSKYAELRATICRTQKERIRFRQLVVNSVIATDIVDVNLKKLREKRWKKAFSSNLEDDERQIINRKATVVIEHLIQASDVAHTMQHWHIYQKWNAKLFEEMQKAYREGRAEKDPGEVWYEGELAFFDFYIIPLAKKLAECGVFGVSSNEYLIYALENRREWEKKGKAIVATMIENRKQ